MESFAISFMTSATATGVTTSVSENGNINALTVSLVLVAPAATILGATITSLSARKNAETPLHEMHANLGDLDRKIAEWPSGRNGYESAVAARRLLKSDLDKCEAAARRRDRRRDKIKSALVLGWIIGIAFFAVSVITGFRCEGLSWSVLADQFQLGWLAVGFGMGALAGYKLT